MVSRIKFWVVFILLLAEDVKEKNNGFNAVDMDFM